MQEGEDVVRPLQAIKIPRPTKELRDKIRRDQIIEAARRCVVRHGFHAASMAEIAAAARMSVGQIYRYFPNKEAIVHAIVERIVEQQLRWMVRSKVLHDLPMQLSRRFLFGGEEENRDDHVLMLEVTAEATRNPRVATILREADRRLRLQTLAAIRNDYPHFTEAQASARFQFFSALSEGSTLRRVTERRGEGESDAVAELYRDVIAGVLSSDPR